MNDQMTLIELSTDEMKDLSGGWNVIEYAAMAIGYVHGLLDSIPEGRTDYAGFGHMGGARP